MSDLTVKDYVFRKGAAKRIPVSGTFELTPRCNFRCKMCYIHMEGEEQRCAGRELTTQEWLTMAREAVDAGMIYLLLTGGEPLLRPDFLELYTSMIQMGLMITINSNASLITPEIVECFRKYPPEKLNISVYGMSEQTYGDLCGNAPGFEKTMRGIRLLKEAGIRMNLNTTFTSHNLSDMEDIIAFARRESIPIRTAAYVFPPVRNGHPVEEGNLTPEEMGRAGARFDWLTLDDKQKERQMRHVRMCLGKEEAAEEAPLSKTASCLAGKGAFWISWDGKMYPCGMVMDNAQDARALGFAAAWKETVSQAKKLCVPEACLECNLRRLCPVCAAVSSNAVHAGDGSIPELCARTKAYIQEMMRLAENG